MFLSENNNFHLRGDGCLEFYITLRKNGDFDNIDRDGNVDEPIRLVNGASAYVFTIATLSAAGGEDMEQNKYVGQVSTIMSLLTSEKEDLLSYFDEIESKVEIKALHQKNY